MRNVFHYHGLHRALAAMRRSIATLSGDFSGDLSPLFAVSHIPPRKGGGGYPRRQAKGRGGFAYKDRVRVRNVRPLIFQNIWRGSWVTAARYPWKAFFQGKLNFHKPR